MRQRRALLRRTVVLAALIGLTGACGGKDSTGPSVTTGSVQVTTATTGADLDSDGYLIAVDGGSAQSIAINASVTVSNVSTGSHSVTLSGLAANCTVSGSNPRSISVTAGATASLSFAVACTALTGSIEVAVNATGVEIPTSFDAVIDGTAGGSVTTGSSATFGPFSVGDHDVELDLAAATNCSLSSGTNPRTVTVPTGASAQTVTTTYAIECTSTDGNIRIAVSTSGTNIPTTFPFKIDGVDVGDVPHVSPQTFGPYALGDHEVEVDLSGATNCSLSSGTNPRTVTVTSGTTQQTVETTFEIECGSTDGLIRIAVNTSGANIPTTFPATIDGNPVGDVPHVSPQTFGPYTIGDHDVGLDLSGATNCSLSSGTNPRTVTVPSGATQQTVETTFEVACTSTDGNIRIGVNTSGANIPATFPATIDANPVGDVPHVSPQTFGPYAIGDHEVGLDLSGATNCSLSSGTNPRTVTVPSGTTQQTVETTFEVACTSTDGNIRIAVSTSGTNVPSSFAATVDGNSVGNVLVVSPQTFGPFSIGTHSVGLTLPGNCTLDSGSNPRDVDVPSGASQQTVETTFPLTCS